MAEPLLVDWIHWFPSNISASVPPFCFVFYRPATIDLPTIEGKNEMTEDSVFITLANSKLAKEYLKYKLEPLISWGEISEMNQLYSSGKMALMLT